MKDAPDRPTPRVREAALTGATSKEAALKHRAHFTARRRRVDRRRPLSHKACAPSAIVVPGHKGIAAPSVRAYAPLGKCGIEVVGEIVEVVKLANHDTAFSQWHIEDLTDATPRL
jgi:hypothetical protein